tara:strand:- start:1233 stop:2210 length:978 start_codon:yes stop_codon:yes gene_type:complete
MASGFAPGKCILFGEHAVVYGHPAVAVAIDSGVRVSVGQSEEWTLEGVPFEPSKHPHISHILNTVFEYDGPPLKMEVKSGLFSAAGLGSSAALSNAIGAALQAHINPSQPLDPIALARMGHSAEAMAQKGRASPTDTATSALGGCIVVSGQQVEGTRHVFDAELETPEGLREWSINAVDLPDSLSEACLVIGFTGEMSSTGKMVASVAKRLEEKPELQGEMDAIGRITNAGLTAMSAGNLEAVGMAMDACHDKLQLLGVSSPSLEALVEAARPHSLGAKLTGSGGGGCMIALAREPQRVAEAIEVAGGRPLISRLGAPGVRLLED